MRCVRELTLSSHIPSVVVHDHDGRAALAPVLVMSDGVAHDSFQASADRVQLASADRAFLVAGVNRSLAALDPVSVEA